MSSKRVLFTIGASLAMAGALTFSTVLARQTPGDAVGVDADDIGGVVTGPKGAEAGVWVIAETTDLPTKFSKTVVTDDRGRYLVPDLPKANYSVWVRGYGLVDSPKVAGVAGEDSQPHGSPGARCPQCGAVLSRGILVFVAAAAREKRISRHRSARQRHLAEHPKPG